MHRDDQSESDDVRILPPEDDTGYARPTRCVHVSRHTRLRSNLCKKILSEEVSLLGPIGMFVIITHVLSFIKIHHV